MVYKWSDLVGQSVANLYFIRAVHAEQQDRASFKASTGDDEIPVLLELVSPDSPDFEDQRQCWITAANIHHDNLVRVLHTDGTVVDGKPMLFCVKEQHDESLATVLDSRPLNETETREVLGAVLSCLDHLHRSHYVHGSVNPSAVLALGDRVKLAPDSIHSLEPEYPGSDDIYAVGVLVMEMLTGRGTAPHLEQIPSPLREVVTACMDSKRRQSLTPADLMKMLEPKAVETPRPAAARPAQPPTTAVPVAAPVLSQREQSPRVVAASSPAPSAAPSAVSPAPVRRKHLPAAAAALAATVLVAVIWQSRRPDVPEPAPAPVVAKQQEIRPSPVTPPDPAASQRTRPAVSTAPPAPQRTPPPVNTAPPAPTATPGGWAVIAAAYKNYEAAEKRAASLRSQFKQCDCSVFPEKGAGKTYYVVVGSGMTKGAAEQLQRQARASRLPSDSYVTLLGDGGTRARQER